MNEYSFDIDTKHTVWERANYTISANSEEEAKQIAEKIFNGFAPELADRSLIEWETLYDTQTEVKPGEVIEGPTMELIWGDGAVLANNAEPLNTHNTVRTEFLEGIEL